MRNVLTSPLLNDHGINHGFLMGKMEDASDEDASNEDAGNKEYPNKSHLWNSSSLRQYWYFLRKLYPSEQVCAMFQEHTNHIHHINTYNHLPYIIACDGMITNQSQRMLVVYTADCIPLLFYAPDTKIIAAIHVGWKGLSLGIIQKTIRSFIEQKSNPATLIGIIGPCIHKNNYEVHQDMKQIMLQRQPSLRSFFYTTKDNEYFDLYQSAQNLCLQGGMKETNVQHIPVDTFEDNRFYSYRRHTTALHTTKETTHVASSVPTHRSQPSFIMMPDY